MHCAPDDDDALFWELEATSKDSWTKHTDFENADQKVSGTIYKKQFEDYTVNVLKSVIIIKNQRIKFYEELLIGDSETYKSNSKNCQEHKVLERDGKWPRIVYVCLKMPMLLTPRESIMRFSRKQLSNN